jgi:hypothetical protein
VDVHADPSTAHELARRYVWWETTDDALKQAVRNRLLGQIMTIGTYEDCELAVSLFGESAFQEALEHPWPGVFNARSWSYWHNRLGLVAGPLPSRRIA